MMIPLGERALPVSLQAIHESAVAAAKSFKSAEADLLEVITKIRNKKVYRYFGCPSVFQYCVQVLKLDAGIVYGFTAVAKKIGEVPELKNEIRDGRLNVSTAKRITSVLTPENKTEWFTKAENLPLKKLEKEVARANPKMEVKERASYLTSKRVRLEMGLDEQVMLKLRRVQDLESQRQRKSVSLEDVMKVIVQEYLERHDPVEKAKRAKIRGKLSEQIDTSSIEVEHNPSSQRSTKPSTRKDSRRTAIPAKLIHRVHLRDKRQCQYMNTHRREQCRNRRFLEIHHKKPISEGGGHELENLVTLCSEHHKFIHDHVCIEQHATGTGHPE